MNIQAKIKAKGFTVAQVASQMRTNRGNIGMSQGSLSSMLNGNPTIDKLKEVADIIGMSLSELVADDVECTGLSCKCPHCGGAIVVSVGGAK